MDNCVQLAVSSAAASTLLAIQTVKTILLDSCSTPACMRDAYRSTKSQADCDSYSLVFQSCSQG